MTTHADPEVAAALRAFRRAEVQLERRRRELGVAIAGAVTQRGQRQADIARQTGYTREHVRRLCRDHG